MDGHFLLENPSSSLMFDYMMATFSAIKKLGRKAGLKKKQVKQQIFSAQTVFVDLIRFGG